MGTFLLPVLNIVLRTITLTQPMIAAPLTNEIFSDINNVARTSFPFLLAIMYSMGQTVSSQTPHNPCIFLVTNRGAADQADLPTFLQDLKILSNGIVGHANELISFFISSFPDSFSTEKLRWLNEVHFLDPLDPNSAEEDSSIEDIGNTLLAQWSRWSKLLKLLNYIRTHDEIHEAADPDGSALSEIRRQLDVIQARSYNFACQMKIALNALGKETVTPEYAPTAEFRSLGRKLEMELQRAYVVTREVKGTSEHDYAYYSSIVDRVSVGDE